MCGTVGLFAGCPTEDTCVIGRLRRGMQEGPDGHTQIEPYQSAYDTWYEKSAVRGAPQRKITATDKTAAIFSQDLVPISIHPLVVAYGADLQRQVRIQQAYRYLNFTTLLEVWAINDVTRDIMTGISGLDLPQSMRLDSFKIYTDEAYHAQFTYELSCQIAETTGIRPLDSGQPAFMSALDAIKKRTDPSLWRVLDYIFVACAETLITGSLRTAGKDEGVDAGLRGSMLDHAIDEGRHHAFYAAFLPRLWHRLLQSEREAVALVVPDLITAFVTPDRNSMVYEFTSYGMKLDMAEQIFAETYTAEILLNHLHGASSHTLRYFRELGADEVSSEVRDNFVKHQYID